MSWQPVNPDREIDLLGRELSLRVPCNFRIAPYSNHAKPIFECSHFASFPVFAIKGALNSGDWSMSVARHNEMVND